MSSVCPSVSRLSHGQARSMLGPIETMTGLCVCVYTYDYVSECMYVYLCVTCISQPAYVPHVCVCVFVTSFCNVQRDNSIVIQSDRQIVLHFWIEARTLYVTYKATVAQWDNQTDRLTWIVWVKARLFAKYPFVLVVLGHGRRGSYDVCMYVYMHACMYVCC